MEKVNSKNIKFYNNIGEKPLQELSVVGGFNTYLDLEQFYHLLKTSDSILEIGAGYGRCIDFFIENKHQGAICGIEYSKGMFDVLKDKYKGIDKVTIKHQDILKAKFDVSFDVAVWLWSGIIDFSRDEQLEACKNIYSFINEGGRLIIDIPRLGAQTIAKHIDQQHLVLQTPYGTIDAYIPNDYDFKRIVEKAGWKRFERHDYNTTTDKQRTQYTLFK